VNFELKRLRPDAVEAALKKAEHYRLLNEPMQAESICRDILEIAPDHRQTLITLILALTDQFLTEPARRADECERLLQQIPDDYQRHYYGGLVSERQAIAQLERNIPGGRGSAYYWFQRAMERFEKAEAIAPAGNDDALLRWNTCARLIMKHGLEAEVEISTPLPLE
jgi:tetratricopeptide (TPR) repeat protein